MFIRTSGPRKTVMIDGYGYVSRCELPKSTETRWVVSRKKLVVKAVKAGLLDRDEAKECYALSDEEFDDWEAKYG